MLGKIAEFKSLLMSLHILYISLVVSRPFLMLLVGVLTMLQPLAPSWLSLPLLDLWLNSLLRNLIRKWLNLLAWLGFMLRTFTPLSILVCLLWLGCNLLASNSWWFLHLVVFVWSFVDLIALYIPGSTSKHVQDCRLIVLAGLVAQVISFSGRLCSWL